MRMRVQTVMFFFSFLPQVQRLIRMVLMRSRCNWEGGKELGQGGEGGSGWRSKVWQVPSEPTRRSCPGTHRPPSAASPLAPCVLICTQQALLANSENCLPQWFTEPPWALGLLEGYRVSTAVMKDLDIKTSLSHFPTFGFGQYLQTELDLQNFPYCQICNCQTIVHQAVWHGLE